MRSRARLIVLVAISTIATILPAGVGLALDPPDAQVFISEIHYDNDGTDVNEAIEVFGPAGTDLTLWSLVLYNGNGGAPYDTIPLTGTLTDQNGGYGVAAFAIAGIQNGAPDGIALVGPSGLAQFLSYEGSFTAVDGPADAVMSSDIGVSEGGSADADGSLQLTGSGVCAGDLAWQPPAANTFGVLGGIDPIPAGDPCGDVGGGGGELPVVHFSEIHYDNAGTDANEAIEVFGPAGTDLTDWSIALYNGNGGTVYDTISLSGVLSDQGGGNGVAAFARAGIQNGAPDGFALVDDEGGLVEFLSYEGTFTADGGAADGLDSTTIGVTEDSSTLADQSLQRDDAGDWHGPLCASFGELNDPDAPVACPLVPVAQFIHDVQGTTDVSPLDGQAVIVEGVVTADFQGGDFLNGFYLQEEDADADSDDTTSEGVFIYDPANAVDVSVGDTVEVTGAVSEFSDQTEITASAVQMVDDVSSDTIDTSVLTPVTLSFPVSETFDYEAIEGMWVVVPQDMYVSEYFNYDRFGEIVIGADRYLTPTAEFEPGSAEVAAAFDLIARGQITLDDGKSGQNPEFLRHPNGAAFSLTNIFRGGDVLNDITGVISPSFGWRIEPNGPATYTAANPRAASPDPVGGRLEVASFNVLNYFTTLDTGSPICGPDENVDCRGANNAEELERQASKIVSALTAIDADVYGLIEIENNVDDEALQDLVDRLNAEVGAGTYDFVRHDDAGVKTVGTDAIRVAILYKTSAVAPVGSDAVLDDPSFLDPLGIGEDKNRAAEAQLFEEIATGEQFSVVVNHLKSKGSSCAPADPDNGDGAGNCNLTREAAAMALTDWIETNPYFAADDDVLLIGDFNSYDKEDPIDALSDAGYADLVSDYQGEAAYSYLFSAQIGNLDYVLANESLADQVTGTTVWHINADEADVLDYNTDFKGPVQESIWAPDAYRSSDHDPVIVGLDLDQTPPVVTASMDARFSTSHVGTFHIEFSCTDNVDPSPDCVADLNGVPVSDGQIAVLIKAPGRSWHLTFHGVLYMKAPSYLLTVVGTDDAGNQSTSSLEPQFGHGWPW